MEIIYKKPNKLPIVMNIENARDEIVRLVGGWYDFVRVQPDVACVHNDKFDGMEPNIWVRGNLICGPVFFAGLHTLWRT